MGGEHRKEICSGTDEFYASVEQRRDPSLRGRLGVAAAYGPHAARPDRSSRHRAVLLQSAADTRTFFVKTVKINSAQAEYNQNTFFEAWRLTIQRYGIYNPYTKRGRSRVCSRTVLTIFEMFWRRTSSRSPGRSNRRPTPSRTRLRRSRGTTAASFPRTRQPCQPKCLTRFGRPSDGGRPVRGEELLPGPASPFGKPARAPSGCMRSQRCPLLSPQCSGAKRLGLGSEAWRGRSLRGALGSGRTKVLEGPLEGTQPKSTLPFHSYRSGGGLNSRRQEGGAPKRRAR